MNLPAIRIEKSSNFSPQGVSDTSIRREKFPATRNSFPEPHQSQRKYSNNRRSLNHEEYTRRDVNSAPNQKQKPTTSPLPQINNLVNQTNDNSSDKQQYQNGYAGITTKERDNRQGRFATIWADTRVTENITARNSDRISEKKKDVKRSPAPPAPDNGSLPRAKSTQVNIKNPPPHTSKYNKNVGVNNDIEEEKPKRDTETELHKLVTLALDKEKEQKPKSPRQRWSDSYPNNRSFFERSQNLSEELSFTPNINKADEVFTVYTGITKRDLRKSNHNERPETDTSQRSDKQQSVSPSYTPQSQRQKKEYMLSKRETGAYLNMHAAYDNQNTQQQRKKQILNKMTKVQLEHIKQRNEMIKKREKRRHESKMRQQKQLTYLRQKFEREKCRRFRSQYVTHRVVEHEIADREDYGLPEGLDEESSAKKDSSAKLKRKQLKPIENVKGSELRKRNEKKYEKMLGLYNFSSVYKHEKVPKMEGIDTVVVTDVNKDGKTIEKKKKVSDVIEEAKGYLVDDSSASQVSKKLKSNKGKYKNTELKKLLEDLNNDDELNKSFDSIDLDEDDDDIFERARKKYGLDVDSSLDANSRL